ncbi:MAG: hypothetical protein ABW042_00105 [Phenylobacterium sp.]
MSLASARAPEPYFAHNGVRYHIAYEVETLTNLKQGVVSARRVQPTVLDALRGVPVPSRAFAGLPDDLMDEIDRGALDFAADLAAEPGLHPPTILPQSFRTLGGRKGREALASHPRLPSSAIRSGVVIEIVDVTRGTPHGRLVELVGLVGQLCRGLFVRLQPVKDCGAPVRGVKLHGVTLDVGDVGGEDADLAGAILRFGDDTRGLAPARVIQGLPEPGFLDVAMVAGFNQAGVRPPADRRQSLYVAEPARGPTVRRTSRAS